MTDLHDSEDHIISSANHNPNAFAQLRSQIPEFRKVFGSLVLDIVEHVNSILKSEGKTRRDLANLLDKTDSEVSKWLSGTHNLTLESVAKMSVALKADLLVSPKFPEGYFGQMKQQAVVVPTITHKALQQLVDGLQKNDSQYGPGDIYDPAKLAQVAGDYSYAKAG